MVLIWWMPLTHVTSLLSLSTWKIEIFLRSNKKCSFNLSDPNRHSCGVQQFCLLGRERDGVSISWSSSADQESMSVKSCFSGHRRNQSRHDNLPVHHPKQCPPSFLRSSWLTSRFLGDFAAKSPALFCLKNPKQQQSPRKWSGHYGVLYGGGISGGWCPTLSTTMKKGCSPAFLGGLN